MISIEQTKDRQGTKLRISYINSNGNLSFITIPIPKAELFEWVKCRKNDPNKSDKYKFFLDGSPVKKKPTNYLTKYRIIEILERLDDDIKKKIYINNEPVSFFIDIETGKDNVTGEWARPNNPTGEITAIALVNAKSNKIYILGLKPLRDSDKKQLSIDINKHFEALNLPYQIDVIYKYYNSENEMLADFWGRYMRAIYFLSGWNIEGFDWPYLVNRSKKLLIDPFELMGVTELKRSRGQVSIPYHKAIVDYLDLYKKFDMKIIKENFTLDYTASQVLKGIKKVTYSGTLDQLYAENPYKFYLYNAIDSYLVKLIDDKLKLISLFISLGSSTMSEMNTLLSTITPVENIIARYYFKENLVFTRKNIDDNASVSYEGGYVFAPKPGYYKWVLTFDFASLYPTVQRQFNISPETYRGKDFERPLAEGEIRLPNGCIFDNSKPSIFKKYLSDYYSKRKASKKIQLELDNEISMLEQMLAKKSQS